MLRNICAGIDSARVLADVRNHIIIKYMSKGSCWSRSLGVETQLGGDGENVQVGLVERSRES